MILSVHYGFSCCQSRRAYWPLLTRSDLKHTLTLTWLYHITNSDAGTLELSSRVKQNSVIYDVCFSSFDVFLRRRVGALSPSPSLFLPNLLLPNLLRPKIRVQFIKTTQVCILAHFAWCVRWILNPCPKYNISLAK